MATMLHHTLVVALLLLGSAAANYYCETSVESSSDPITRYEGKMNVPIKPAVEPEAVLFLWPGLNPYGGMGGMMQVRKG